MYFYTLLDATTAMCLYKMQIQIDLCSVEYGLLQKEKMRTKSLSAWYGWGKVVGKRAGLVLSATKTLWCDPTQATSSQRVPEPFCRERASRISFVAHPSCLSAPSVRARSCPEELMQLHWPQRGPSHAHTHRLARPLWGTDAGLACQKQGNR